MWRKTSKQSTAAPTRTTLLSPQAKNHSNDHINRVTLTSANWTMRSRGAALTFPQNSGLTVGQVDRVHCAKGETEEEGGGPFAQGDMAERIRSLCVARWGERRRRVCGASYHPAPPVTSLELFLIGQNAGPWPSSDAGCL